MIRRIEKHLTLLLAIAAVCWCTAAAAAPDSKVAWAGETFLDVTYKQVEGRPIKMDIYMPPAGKPEAAPVLYYVHGGGWAAGSKAKGGLPLIDPDAFTGDASLADSAVRPIAGISWYGPTDFTDVALFKTGDSDKNPDRFGPRITGTAGGYAENPRAYEEMSPYFWIKKDSPPLLLLQGDTDTTIPLPHAPHLKTKADKIGAAVTMVIVKNSGHNWRKAGGNPKPGVKEIQRMTAEYAVRQVKAKPKKD